MQPEPPPDHVAQMDVSEIHPQQNELGIPDEEVEDDEDESAVVQEMRNAVTSAAMMTTPTGARDAHQSLQGKAARVQVIKQSQIVFQK